MCYQAQTVKYFEYRVNGEKVGGGGFAKMNCWGDRCSMTLQLSNLRSADMGERTVTFVSRNREIDVCPVNLTEGRGRLEFRDLDCGNLLGSGIDVNGLEGIRIFLTPERELFCVIKESDDIPRREREEIKQEGTTEQTVQETAEEKKVRDEETMQGTAEEKKARDEETMQGTAEEKKARDEETVQGTAEEKKARDEEIVQGTAEEKKVRGEETMQGTAEEKKVRDEETMQETAEEKKVRDEETVQGTAEGQRELVLTAQWQDPGDSPDSPREQKGQFEEEKGDLEGAREHHLVKEASQEGTGPKGQEGSPESCLGNNSVKAERFGERNAYAGSMKPGKWEQLWSLYPIIRPFADDRQYLSIGPGDFVILKDKSYRKVNNSFLLHGYFHYKHLILHRSIQGGETRYYIGVPGNFFEKEKEVALLFGFESFECRQEPAQKGEFGYYMMRVEL